MFTLIIMSNFKGTKKETIEAAVICLGLDALITIPTMVMSGAF